MYRHLTPRALVRAQWLSDLNRALEDADLLLNMLASDGGFPDETAKLRLRVQTVRSEIELLNRVVAGEGRVVGRIWPVPTPSHMAEQ